MKKRSMLLVPLAAGWLSGCAQLQERPSQSEIMLPAEAISSSSHYQPSLHNQVMFEVMLGEMLVQKGALADAYEFIYNAAQKSRDPALAHRAFQLSMTTFSVEQIEKSAALWRELAPNEATPWRVGYIMALRQGDLERGWALWHAYRERSSAALEDDLKNSAAQVSQATPKDIGLEFFSRIQQHYPDEWAAGYAYGYIAGQYGETDLAISLLQQVIKQQDAPSEVYFSLANFYIENEMAEEGLRRLRDYVLSHPDDWSMQERYARMEVRAGLNAQAKLRYEEIVQANPMAHTSRLSLALLELEDNNIAAAQQHLESLVVIAGYEDVSHYYLGLIAHNEMRYEQAMMHLNQVSHRGYYVDARLLMAQMVYDQSGLQPALDLLDQLDLTMDEQQIKVLRARALLFGQAGKINEAIQAYQDARVIDETNLQINYALAMMLYEAQMFDEAESVLLETLQLYPNEPDVLNALGYLYAEQNKQLDQAQIWLDRAMELAPGRFYILDSRAWLAYQQGDLALAEKLIKQAWALQKDDVVLLHLIKIKWALGKKEEAEHYWQTYHELFPDNAELAAILQTLE